MRLFQKTKPRSRYGWIPDIPDRRDYLYRHIVPQKKRLPPIVDLRSGMSQVEDQGEIGSCTAQAIVGALEYLDNRDGNYTDWSRLFLYYNERLMQGWQNEDTGAFIRDGIKSLTRDGICPESVWPYNVKKFAVKPCKQSYEAAFPHMIQTYARIGSLSEMLNCLASGFPFIFGFTVYESFEALKTPYIVPMPFPGERSLGGHAVLAVGYDQPKKLFIVRNSWGSEWGSEGYYFMPFDYLTDGRLSDDFWFISKAKL